jgi:hypothetical protein
MSVALMKHPHARASEAQVFRITNDSRSQSASRVAFRIGRRTEPQAQGPFHISCRSYFPNRTPVGFPAYRRQYNQNDDHDCDWDEYHK